MSMIRQDQNTRDNLSIAWTVGNINPMHARGGQYGWNKRRKQTSD